MPQRRIVRRFAPLALFALALALFAGSAVGRALPASAAGAQCGQPGQPGCPRAPQPAPGSTPCATGCTIEISFSSVTFPQLDDCSWGAPCDLYEQSMQAYGSFTGAIWRSGTFADIQKTRFGGWGGQPGFCPDAGVSWTDSALARASCLRSVSNAVGEAVGNNDPSYHLDDTYMCHAQVNATCSATYMKNNNHLFLVVRPGDVLMIGALIYDYDTFSSDDVICNVSSSLGSFSAEQLATLRIDDGSLSMPFNGDGACSLAFTAQRVG